MNLQEIKNAVDNGLPVKWANPAYDVIKDSLGQYLIVYDLNGSTIGLHGLTGTRYEDVLNGDESQFFVHDQPSPAAGKGSPCT